VSQAGGGGPGDPPFVRADRNFTEAPAADTVLSLSQAILAPVDALLKVQVHAARSFLNFLLQIGYRHKPKLPADTTGRSPAEGDAAGDGDADKDEGKEGIPYQMDFYRSTGKGKREKISVPTLALVPVSALGVTSSEFSFAFHVREIAKHRQIRAQESEKTELERQTSTESAKRAPAGVDPSAEVIDRNTRPWFLVDTPLSVQGSFAPAAGSKGESASEARFEIKVCVGTLPMPAALDKLLTSLSQSSTVDGDH
jgi:hypothetical protein